MGIYARRMDDVNFEMLREGRVIPISMLLCEDATPSREVPRGLDPCRIGKPRARARPRWRPEEDAKLYQLKTLEESLSWSALASNFPSKTGKQLRLRWLDHLSPDIVKKPWGREEDEILLAGHQKYGNSWSRIAKNLPGRSDAMTKNRFYQLARRRARAFVEKDGRDNDTGSSSDKKSELERKCVLQEENSHQIFDDSHSSDFTGQLLPWQV